jgi:peptide/nickel transport system permease protein
MRIGTLRPGHMPGGRKVKRREWVATLGAAARIPRGRVGLLITAFVLLVAVVGPFVAPYSPTTSVGIPFASPSSKFLLGTDDIGRDVLSRTLAGGWILLVMALGATVLGVGLGSAAGISAAYLRGKTDWVIMRGADVILAFPSLIFALLLVSVLGPKLWLIVCAVGVSHAPAVARVLRAAVLDISERDYVKAVELQGAGAVKVMRSEILPNLVSPLMVESGLRLTFSIVIMSGLAYLGFGQAPPAPNWGYMINENFIGLQANPWGVVAPVVLIALLTIGTNTFTDAVARVGIGVERPPEEAALITPITPSTGDLA